MVKKVVEQETVRYKDCIDEITALIKARAPIIWVVTHEESRFIDDFETNVAKKLKRGVWTWSAWQGLIKKTASEITGQAQGEEKGTNNPQKALQRIVQIESKSSEKGLCFLMKDFHNVLVEPVPRQIRDMYEHLTGTAKTLIVVSPVMAHGAGGKERGLPPTMEKQICVVEYGLPGFQTIRQRISNIVDQMKMSLQGPETKYKLEYAAEELTDFAKALQGLTLLEIETAVASSLTHLHKLDVDKLIQDKRQLIRKSQILEFIDEPVGMGEVGGLDQAKFYLNKYAQANTEEAQEFGVEPLKGILLTGVPGTGKSLLAKAIGKLWKTPLLRLDVGKVMTGLVGGSESKMREVIQQAESMTPCILWIDEVEKSLSGTKSSNFSDGGTLARVFGTLLTAMQDGMKGVTIVATANDITMLPPEFIRRFNEVFFVDLPGPEERWEIFSIHLGKRKRKPENFEKFKQELLDSSNNYTGAEIEKAVKDAIAAAFYAGSKDLNHKNLLDALNDTKPISKVMADKIQKIRDKAKGQYRFASTWSEQQMNGHKVLSAKGKSLDVEEACGDLDEFIAGNNKPTQKSKDRFEELE